jgi:regulator of protease activity HflC (stomatin/prohibitin superfamily)
MIDWWKDENFRVKNIIKKKFEVDFNSNPIGVLVFVLFSSAAFSMYYLIAGINSENDLYIFLFTPVLFALCIMIIRRWELVIKTGFVIILFLWWYHGVTTFYYSSILIMGAVMMPFIQIAKEWERAIILRLGKFKKVRGPGVFIVLPFIDKVSKIVDLRIRVTDFVAETTLTKDSVTVTVDALCFWLVWDAEKAILEVENYVDAVVLSSQTALRNAISKNSLSTLLEEGELIEEHIRKEVDKKTTEWGITVQHIEITDIQIPVELQDSLSRLAQAEREKKSRILLGEAEIEVAKKLEEASVIYKDNETAMKLKKLSVINEGLKAGNSMILVPSNVSDELQTDNLFGVKAMGEINKMKKEKKDEIK